MKRKEAGNHGGEERRVSLAFSKRTTSFLISSRIPNIHWKRWISTNKKKLRPLQRGRTIPTHIFFCFCNVNPSNQRGCSSPLLTGTHTQQKKVSSGDLLTMLINAAAENKLLSQISFVFDTQGEKRKKKKKLLE